MPYPIERYLNVQAAYGPTFSADGRKLAFLTNITGIAQLWQVDTSAGLDTIPWPEQLTFAADRVMSAHYAPVGDRLVYSHDVGGNEKAQLFLLAWDEAGGLQERSLTAGHEEAMHLMGDWSRDGQTFLFAANRRHPALFDLYQGFVDGRSPRLVWQNDAPGYLFNAAFSADERSAAVTRAGASFSHDLFEIELDGGAVRQLNPGARAARYAALAYSNDGRSLYLNTDLDRDFLYIARLDLETLEFEPALALDWDIEALSATRDGRRLAFSINDDGTGLPALLDTTTGELRRAPAVDGAPGVAASDDRFAFTSDGRRVAFAYSSARRTHDIFIWDLGADTVVPATCASHAGLPRASFVVPELIHYPTFDSRQIPAWFYLPPGEEQGQDVPLPVIVIVHGGPEGQSRPIFNPLVQYFLQHGYAALLPNVRGSVGYGKAYSHLDDVEKRMDSVTDLAHAANWLRQNPLINGERIAVYGGSYGGFMVLAVLTSYPELWAAGVDIVGISNLATFLENTSDYRRAHRESEYGSLARDRAFLESIAPINKVDEIVAPLMVIHGANDPRVPLSEAEQLVAALKEREVPVTFLVFDDEGHGIAKLKNKLVAYRTVVDFLHDYLA